MFWCVCLHVLYKIYIAYIPYYIAIRKIWRGIQPTYTIQNIILNLTPVDPAGPDCYQSGTKPCEST